MKVHWVSQEHILCWFGIDDDFKFDASQWANQEMLNWCYNNNCTIFGNWVECPDAETYVLFGLRWAT